MISIEVINDAAAFARLRPEWTELLASSRSDSLFLTWEWLHTWWKHLGEGRQLFIAALRHDSRLVALAPLAVSRPWPSVRTLEFLGTGSVGSDYLDFIVDRAYERVAVGALAEFLADSGFSFRLPSVTKDSIIASLFAKNLCDRGWRFREVPMQVCPFISLPSQSFDAYLDVLGASHRYNFRRRLRNLEKAYAVRFEDSRDALQHVIDLHLRRWSVRGGSDGFHDERLLAFHHEFSALAREKGWLRLRLLTLDGHPAAAFYGFRYGHKYCFYQSGFDEDFLKQSVGLVMVGLTIREAIEERATEYDLLHGDETYKSLWTKTVRPLFRIELYPPGVIGRMHRDGVAAVAATKRIVKRALYAPLNR